ncbi:MAG: hypothetical protein L0227_06915 [Chloroflexi bacterium]|nr:hypothetical protein [Chloroflexota bacterium]
MDGSQVVIKKVYVSTGDLKRRGAVAEDPLQGEDVASVAQERPREGVPEDVGRAPRCQLGAATQSPDELLDGPWLERAVPAAHEEGVLRTCRATPREPLTQGAPCLSPNWHDALAATLAHDPTAAFDEVQIANANAGRFA